MYRQREREREGEGERERRDTHNIDAIIWCITHACPAVSSPRSCRWQYSNYSHPVCAECSIGGLGEGGDPRPGLGGRGMGL